MKNTILVIEDSVVMLDFERAALQERFDFPVITAQTYAQARKILETRRDELFVALADLVLPDAPSGEIIDLLTADELPTIVITGQYDEQLREFIMAKPIVDYILKNNLNNFQYAMRLVSVIHSNQSVKALVIDDSRFARMKVELSLRRLHINVFQADGIHPALEMLKEHDDISLILTDYHMQSGESGIDLTREIRTTRSSDQVIIIGYSRDTSTELPIEFLKNGANDFIPYNYIEEEFTLRVLNNLELMAYLRSAQDMARKDFMTGLYNRRYLFELSRALFAQVERGKLQLGVAIFDIDFFKKINDTYGHQVGDEAIKHTTNLLSSNIRKSDLLARIGGEEFCLVVQDADNEYMFNVLEKLRRVIETTTLDVHLDPETVTTVAFTISIGFTTHPYTTLDQAIKEADEHLYKAKKSGRNCIRYEE